MSRRTDSFRIALRHRANQFQRQLAVQADEKLASGHAMNRLARDSHGLNRCRKRIAALEQDLEKNVLVCPAFTNVMDVQFELLFEYSRFVQDFSIPRQEARFCKFEHSNGD